MSIDIITVNNRQLDRLGINFCKQAWEEGEKEYTGHHDKFSRMPSYFAELILNRALCILIIFHWPII
ncbi:MAG TPA: hypothetical protein VMT12_03250 [Syntrophales bacterium]|nr:hypothetical protein [Syntrophales bacterium]